MHASFVRGDVISVLRTNAHGVGGKGLVPGDTVKVGGRKKNGWLRVRCKRTNSLVTIRAGDHLCLASEASRAASKMDLLIRESQVASAEARAKHAEQELAKARMAAELYVEAAHAHSAQIRAVREDRDAALKAQREVHAEEMKAALGPLRTRIKELEEELLVAQARSTCDEQMGEYWEMKQAQDEAEDEFEKVECCKDENCVM